MESYVQAHHHHWLANFENDIKSRHWPVTHPFLQVNHRNAIDSVIQWCKVINYVQKFLYQLRLWCFDDYIQQHKAYHAPCLINLWSPFSPQTPRASFWTTTVQICKTYQCNIALDTGQKEVKSNTSKEVQFALVCQKFGRHVATTAHVRPALRANTSLLHFTISVQS